MKYKIYYQNKDKLKSIIIDAFNMQSLKSSIDYPSNIIYINEIKKFNFTLFDNKNEKLEMFYEMKTMLDSNLQFKYIIDILINSDFSKKNKEILQTIKQSIKNGQSIYESLLIHKNYLGNSIIFFKIAQENSTFKQAILAMYKMQKQEEKIKQDIKNILAYPIILFSSVIFTIYILFLYVVPKFENIYAQFGSNLPYSTKILLDVKYIISNEYLYLLGFIILFIIISRIIHVIFKYQIDKILFHFIPIFSTLYRNIIFYKLL